MVGLDVVSILRELDFRIAERAGVHNLLVAVMPSVERVSARTIRNSIAHQGSPVRPLFAGRTATDGVLEQARAGQIDVLTEQSLQLILKGTVFTSEPFEQAASVQRKNPRKVPWGSWAIERCLLLADMPMHQSEIAGYVGVSQQMVSRVCKNLGPLVTSPIFP
ncbi:hypothetical protein ACT3TP_16355 [Glutamicibacter sp. AOP38-B1-38]|uniref:hypothetical protein n=1 Tax=Glutamicibacter sp. AOP38-B1-38 TaxID=3457680 RepID=UPI003FBA3687